jgi:hypothetical protein
LGGICISDPDGWTDLKFYTCISPYRGSMHVKFQICVTILKRILYPPTSIGPSLPIGWSHFSGSRRPHPRGPYRPYWRGVPGEGSGVYTCRWVLARLEAGRYSFRGRRRFWTGLGWPGGRFRRKKLAGGLSLGFYPLRGWPLVIQGRYRFWTRQSLAAGRGSSKILVLDQETGPRAASRLAAR